MSVTVDKSNGGSSINFGIRVHGLCLWTSTAGPAVSGMYIL